MDPQHRPPTRAPSRVLRALAVAALPGLAWAVVAGTAVAETPRNHPGPPSVEGAQADIDRATQTRADAIAERTHLQGELGDVREEIAALGDEQASLTHELEIARRRVRVVTVRAYTGGNGARELAYLMDADGAGDHLWRQEMLTGNVLDTHQAIADYEDLRSQADQLVIELAERTDELVAAIGAAGVDIRRASVQINRARVELGAAQAAARQNASGHDDPGEEAWDALRFCESGGVYTIDTGNGYYGAYQFDLQTWQSMAGTGNPARAPYWEQDIRAKALFQARGDQPWPVCGRFLR